MLAPRRCSRHAARHPIAWRRSCGARRRRAIPAVVARLREAAAIARDRGAPATAAALLERALAEPPPEELRGELLVELGRDEIAVGRSRDATDHLLAADRCATDPRVRARALAMLPQADPGHAGVRDQLLALVDGRCQRSSRSTASSPCACARCSC
jgi:hypothetical protein